VALSPYQVDYAALHHLIDAHQLDLYHEEEDHQVSNINNYIYFTVSFLVPSSARDELTLTSSRNDRGSLRVNSSKANRPLPTPHVTTFHSPRSEDQVSESI
jgi:hypothetical protein